MSFRYTGGLNDTDRYDHRNRCRYSKLLRLNLERFAVCEPADRRKAVDRIVPSDAVKFDLEVDKLGRASAS